MIVRIEDLHPRFQRLLVEPKKLSHEMKGTLELVSDKDRPLLGKVLAVGEGRWVVSPSGTHALIPLKTAVGAYVTFGKYAGQKMELSGKTYMVLEEAEVLCEVDNLKEEALDGEPTAQ